MQIFSSDVNENENEFSETTCWDNLIDDFGDLVVESSIQPEQENSSLSLAAYIDSFVNELTISNLPHKIVDDIINYSKDLVSKTTAINLESMRNNIPANAESILTSTEEFVTSHLNKFGTRYRRKNHFAKYPHYVAPRTIRVGEEETFQSVSILKTLGTLFGNERFRDEYYAYNENHECKVGIYDRHCCAQNFRKSSFLQLNKNSIQIQIFYDDRQLTSPLKTKPYKVCAIYFIVRNFPPKFVSKLDNMYLVSLCDSKIIDKYGVNSILEEFVREMKILEKDGITIELSNHEKISLKGSLVQVSFDNLGGNAIFGFTKSFSSIYYCRICVSTKKHCQKRTIEVADTIRTKQHYIEQISKIRQLHDQGTKFKLKDTFGIANYSILNDLSFYHTIDNRSQDIMHDIYEGAMPFVLRIFLKRLIEKDIITEKQLEEKINSFDYGRLESKNLPSKLCLKKRNLNQNASQMHCLMTNIPFILIDLLQQNNQLKRSFVHNNWPAIEYMLKIDQIISSPEVEEKDLINLEKFTHEFLTFVKIKFETKFIPKLHFITHYANTVRIMGPLINLQMMRGDAKHQTFTQYAKRCKNYRNISKTLAEKHQEVLAAKWKKNTFSDTIERSKRMFKIVGEKGELIRGIENHSKLFHSTFKKDINRVSLINFVTINSFMLRKGLFIISGNKMHQIDAVLTLDNIFILLCTKYDTVKFYKFANCFEIKSTTQSSLIEYDTLVCKRSYEAKYINNQTQIIAENVGMIPIYEECLV